MLSTSTHTKPYRLCIWLLRWPLKGPLCGSEDQFDNVNYVGHEQGVVLSVQVNPVTLKNRHRSTEVGLPRKAHSHIPEVGIPRLINMTPRRVEAPRGVTSPPHPNPPLANLGEHNSGPREQSHD